MGLFSWLLGPNERITSASSYFGGDRALTSYHDSPSLKQSLIEKLEHYRKGKSTYSDAHTECRSPISHIWKMLSRSGEIASATQFEAEVGIPAWLALLADALCDQLIQNGTESNTLDTDAPAKRQLHERALLFPERMFRAIPIGVDLIPARHRLMAWLLGPNSPIAAGHTKKSVGVAVWAIRRLHERAACRDQPTVKEWETAYSDAIAAEKAADEAETASSRLSLGSATFDSEEWLPLFDGLVSARAAKESVSPYSDRMCKAVNVYPLTRYPVAISERLLIELEACGTANPKQMTTRELRGTIRSRRGLLALLRGESTRENFVVHVVSPGGTTDDLTELRPYEEAFRDWYNPQTGWISRCSEADLKRLNAIRLKPENNGVLELTTFVPSDKQM